MDELISRTSWMRDIPDDAPMTTLSIPGTHNSCCVDGPLGFGQTQNLDLPDQLNAGIRFLDIRLAHHQDNLCVHHDVICMEKSYVDVLAICSDFLGRYPSETILMSVADEGRVDDALGKYAPSLVSCRLTNVENPGENTRSFEETFKEKTREGAKDASLFYNATAAVTLGANSAGIGPAITSEIKLGELRGKVILLRRFEGSQGVGIDLSCWPENRRFRSVASPFYDIEDRYRNPGRDDKFDFVVEHIEDARRGDPQDLYLTFSSAVDLATRAYSYSREINSNLNEYLKGLPQGRVGIIVMDFFEEPRELVSNVIKMNSMTGASSGHDCGPGSHDPCACQ